MISITKPSPFFLPVLLGHQDFFLDLRAFCSTTFLSRIFIIDIAKSQVLPHRRQVKWRVHTSLLPKKSGMPSTLTLAWQHVVIALFDIYTLCSIIFCLLSCPRTFSPRCGWMCECINALHRSLRTSHR